jgi:hypothetical protein
MIIREENDHLILISQHDHGILSGEIAFHWGNKNFPSANFEQIISATYHDFAWYEYDKEMKWDNEKDRPYDFVHYPTEEKLLIYKNGITQLEKLHPYCALITSYHYCSFFLNRKSKECKQFVHKEKIRQEKLMQLLRPDSIRNDLSFLKLVDDISLFVCLNKPGAKRNEEHPWYQEGITFKSGDRDYHFNLHWVSQEKIQITPFPFKQEWQTNISYKVFCKKTKQIISDNKLTITFQ